MSCWNPSKPATSKPSRVHSTDPFCPHFRCANTVAKRAWGTTTNHLGQNDTARTDPYLERVLGAAADEAHPPTEQKVSKRHRRDRAEGLIAVSLAVSTRPMGSRVVRSGGR